MPYWPDYYNHWAFPFGSFFPLLVPLLILIAVWSLIWKGMALLKAARSGEKNWFIVLLVVNTLGILEILYLYVFSRKPAPLADKPAQQ